MYQNFYFFNKIKIKKTHFLFTKKVNLCLVNEFNRSNVQHTKRSSTRSASSFTGQPCVRLRLILPVRKPLPHTYKLIRVKYFRFEILTFTEYLNNISNKNKYSKTYTLNTTLADTGNSCTRLSQLPRTFLSILHSRASSCSQCKSQPPFLFLNKIGIS